MRAAPLAARRRARARAGDRRRGARARARASGGGAGPRRAGGARGKHVVVVGGGIHGCSAAYHLAKRGARVTLLEREDSVAPAASGQAGFLARDWGDSATREFPR